MSRIGRRVAIAFGWFVVAWIAAYVVAHVVFGSANVLLWVIAVSVGVGAYAVLSIRDRRLAAGHHR